MAKKGMARPGGEHAPSHHAAPPVPEIEGGAKHGKEQARPIIEGTLSPQMKVYHERKGDGPIGDTTP